MLCSFCSYPATSAEQGAACMSPVVRYAGVLGARRRAGNGPGVLL